MQYTFQSQYMVESNKDQDEARTSIVFYQPQEISTPKSMTS